MKKSAIIEYIFFAMIVFVTFGLPFSFFFASAVILKAALIVTGIIALLYWSLFLIRAFEYLGGKH